MNIEEKITLSNDWNSIYFFTEGIFAQIFGVSLYLVIEKLGLPLKVYGNRYKKLNNELILRAGLPYKTLEKHYGKALIKHDFGYELPSEIVREENIYRQWYQERLVQALIEEQQGQQTAKKRIKDNNQIPLIGVKHVLTESICTRILVLSEQEYEFLKTWQQDKYLNYIESEFIRGLHQKIACRSA